MPQSNHIILTMKTMLQTYNTMIHFSKQTNGFNSQALLPHLKELLTSPHRNKLADFNLFQKINYDVWNDLSLPQQIRQLTTYFNIISNWIVSFQLRINKLPTIAEQFILLTQFLDTETNFIGDRLIILQQCYEDLTALINKQFWHHYSQNEQSNTYTVSIKDIESVLHFLKTVIRPKYTTIGAKRTLSATQQSIPLPKTNKFIYDSLSFIILSDNLPSSIQTQVTKLTLLQLQQPYFVAASVALLTNLLNHTSKAVKYALTVEYVAWYEYIQKIHAQSLLQAIESIPSFRELVFIKAEQATIIPDLGFREEVVKAGATHRVYFNKVKQGEGFVRLVLALSQNDIGLYVGKCKRMQEEVCWKEQKTGSKVLELLLEDNGLYFVQFDNSYSWINSKNISYTLSVYYPLK